MKNRKIKRVVSLLTAVTLFTGLFSGLNGILARRTEAASSVEYTRQYAGVNIMPLALADNRDFMRTYVYKDGGFNITSKFLNESSYNIRNGISSGEPLSYERQYWHKDNENWFANYKFDFSGYFVFKKLIEDGQIQKGYKASLTSDYHRHIGIHKDQQWDVASVRMTDGKSESSISSAKEKDELPQDFYGRSDVNVDDIVDGQYRYDRFAWNMSHSGCNCGSSAVSGSSIYLVDKKQPYVSKIYASTDAKGEKPISEEGGYKTGETGYIVLEFNENIRFAMDETSDLKLKLDLYGTLDDQQITGKDNFEASLISLNNKKMVFKFTVPETLNGKGINAYIKCISAEQNWVGQTENPFPYVLIDENGKKYEVSEKMSRNMYCSSMITDLAGNPVDWSASTKMITNNYDYASDRKNVKVYLDSVAPELNKIAISGNMITAASQTDKDSWPADIDRSSVFAGVGDWLTFNCYFTERLNLDQCNWDDIKALLNVKDKDGNQVALSLNKNSVENGKAAIGKDASSENISILTFDNFYVQEGMQPLTADGSSIQIVGIQGLEAATDMRGNKLMDVSKVSIKAAQQEYLDVHAPEISIGLSVNEGTNTYTPISSGGYTFTIPITVSDKDSSGRDDYNSGVTGLNGLFSLVNNDIKTGTRAYQWYIDTNQGISDTANWHISNMGPDEEHKSKTDYNNIASKIRFAQTEEQQYIHIKLDENTDYSYDTFYLKARLDVHVYDYAGNSTDASYELVHDADNVRPLIEEVNKKFVVDTKDDSSLDANISVKVRISDKFGIGDTLTYEYDKDGEKIIKSIDLNKGDKEQTVEINDIKVTDAELEKQKGTKEVTLRVTDVKGNETTEIINCEYEYRTITSDYTIADKGTIGNPLTFNSSGNLINIMVNQPSSINLSGGEEKTRTLMLIPLGTEEIDGKDENTYLAFITSTDGKIVDKNIFSEISNSISGNYIPASEYPYADGGYCFKLKGNIEADGSKGTLEKVIEYNFNNANVRQYREQLNKVYGNTEVLFITSTEFVTNAGKDNQFNYGNVDKERCLVERENLCIVTKSEYSINIPAIVDSEGNSIIENVCFDKDSTTITINKTISSLADIFARLEITNDREKDGETVFGYSRIDTENSSYTLYKLSKHQNGNVYNRSRYTGNIEKSGKQLLNFPDEIEETETYYGPYSLKINIVTYEGESFNYTYDKYIFIEHAEYTTKPYVSGYQKAYSYKNQEISSDETGNNTVIMAKNQAISSDTDTIRVGLADKSSDGYICDPSKDASTYNRLVFNKGILKDISVYRDYTVVRNYKVRAWSALDPDGEKNAVWYDLGDNESTYAYELVLADEFTADSYTITDSNGNILAALPVKAGENLIYFEFKYNDNEPERNSVVLKVATDNPEFNIYEEYHGNNQVQIRIGAPEDVDSNNKCRVGYSWLGTYTSDISMNDENGYIIENYYKEGTVRFYAADSYGNLWTEDYEITDVDSIDPVISTSVSSTESGFYIKSSVYDNKGISPENITMNADAAYSALLMGMTYDEWFSAGASFLSFAVPFNTEGDGIWESLDDSVYGIYKTKIKESSREEYSDGTSSIWNGYEIEIWGEYKQPDDITDDSSFRLKLSVTDDKGNGNSDFWLEGRAKQTVLKIDSLSEEGYPIVTSNTAISAIKGFGAGKLTISEQSLTNGGNDSDDVKENENTPENSNSSTDVKCYTTLPMINVDGKYELTYVDLFGNEHSQEVVVTVFGNSDIDIHFSNTEITNENVVVSVGTKADGDSITGISAVYNKVSDTSTDNVSASGNSNNDINNNDDNSNKNNIANAETADVYGTIDKLDSGKASIELEKNGLITVTTELGKTYTVRVTNIDKELEPAEIVYVYNGMSEPILSESDPETILTQVTAIVKCTEDIDGVDGKLSYTYTYGSKKGDEHTFTYRDEAGNIGEITAILPYNIVKRNTDTPVQDITSPEYDMIFSGMRNDRYNYLASYSGGGDIAVTDDKADDNLDNNTDNNNADNNNTDNDNDGNDNTDNDNAGNSAANTDTGIYTTEEYDADSSKGAGYEISSIASDIVSAAQYKAQQYKLSFTIADESDTKLIVKSKDSAGVTSYEDYSDDIKGVTISGNNIIITDNSSFNVYIVDSNNNVTAIKDIDITGVDNKAPKVVPVYEPVKTSDGYEGVRVWMDVENDENIISVDAGTPAVRVKLDDGSEVIRYYKDYDKNTTDIFNYKDVYGNHGKADISVQALDTQAPVVTGTAWYGIGAAKDPEDVKSDTWFSNDVIANINMSKPIVSVQLYQYDADAAATDYKGDPVTADDNISVSVQFKGMNATVSYENNVNMKLVAELTVGNGRKTYAVLPAVQCIDKVKPVLSDIKTQVTDTKTQVTYTFTTDEPTLFTGSTSTEYSMEHTMTVTKNGSSTVKFTDAAGNVTQYQFVTDQIDDKLLELKYSKNSDGTDEVSDPHDLSLNIGDSIYVKATKNAVIGISGTQISNEVNAGEWNEVKLDGVEQGIYILKATDAVTKREVYENLLIKLNDTMAPVISFDNNSISIKNDVSLDDMNKVVRSGVKIEDNNDGVIEDYTVTGIPERVSAGYYTLTYKAEDSSGNEASVSRMLYIADINEPDIYINDVKALPNGMILTDSNTLITRVSGLNAVNGIGGLNNQSVMIKWKAGIKTTGQMKYGASVIGNNESIKLSKAGYYTIYVRTGNRKEYIFHIHADFE